MKPSDPHGKSHSLRRFKPNRKPTGIFCTSVVFVDTAMLMLAFFLALSPFVLQPGINLKLPESPFTDGARFGSLVLAVTHSGWFYFNDERVDEEELAAVLRAAAMEVPGMPLIVEADERVAHGQVVMAWNAALEAGISEVSIASRISAVTESRP
jgi:biopolymer transport protein ExbD